MPNGALQIIDRKKNIYKLSLGEYVAPEKVQNIYARCPYVAESFLYGNSLKDYNIAIIHPNLEALQMLAKKMKIGENDPVKLCEDKRIVDFVLQAIIDQGKNDGLFGFEQARKIKLWPEPFMKAGIVTNTMKLQRHQAHKFFEKKINILYEE